MVQHFWSKFWYRNRRSCTSGKDPHAGRPTTKEVGQSPESDQHVDHLELGRPDDSDRDARPRCRHLAPSEHRHLSMRFTHEDENFPAETSRIPWTARRPIPPKAPKTQSLPLRNPRDAVSVGRTFIGTLPGGVQRPVNPGPGCSAHLGILRNIMERHAARRSSRRRHLARS